MKKIIDYGRVWTCENMDNLAPIDWEGYKVLFSDGEVQIVGDLSEIKEYQKASEKEIRDFYRERNFIFIGDEVEVVKGRKLPIGEHKIVKDFFIYDVNGTYGHRKVKYVAFIDGTKTDIRNIKNIKCKNDMEYPKEFIDGYNLSGRL